MSEPAVADDATHRWSLIFRGSAGGLPVHDRAEWTRIAAAIQVADQELSGGTGSGWVRGDAVWCRAAVDAYHRVPTIDGHRTEPGGVVCHADEDVIRAWLEGPWIPDGDRLQSTAQVNGATGPFVQGGLPDAATLTILVDQAHDAGVFGVPGGRVTLWRFFGDGTLPEHTFKVSVRMADGSVRTSALLGADGLVRPEREPVAVIVGLLQGVAGFANDLLTAPHDDLVRPVVARDGTDRQAPASPVPPGVAGHPVGERGRAFPPLCRDDTDPGPDVPQQPQPTPGTRRHR